MRLGLLRGQPISTLFGLSSQVFHEPVFLLLRIPRFASLTIGLALAHHLIKNQRKLAGGGGQRFRRPDAVFQAPLKGP